MNIEIKFQRLKACVTLQSNVKLVTTSALIYDVKGQINFESANIK